MIQEIAVPFINYRHCDGPVLVSSKHTLHWLTWWDRMCLKAGFTTLDDLDEKYTGSVSPHKRTPLKSKINLGEAINQYHGAPTWVPDRENKFNDH